MRQLIWKGLAGSSLLLVALSGSAQVRDRDGAYDRREYRQEEGFPNLISGTAGQICGIRPA